jgi:hypothetical protein
MNEVVFKGMHGVVFKGMYEVVLRVFMKWFLIV